MDDTTRLRIEHDCGKLQLLFKGISDKLVAPT